MSDIEDRIRPPALLPHLLADGAGHARRLRRGRHHARARGCRPAISSTSLVRVASMNLSRSRIGMTNAAGTADHAVLVIDVEVLDIHGEGVRPLQHDRQAVDGDARWPAPRRAPISDERPAIVGAVAGHVDHAAEAAIAAVVEQRLGETAARRKSRCARRAGRARARFRRRTRRRFPARRSSATARRPSGRSGRPIRNR